jgi:flagellar basal body-associated protein FliL
MRENRKKSYMLLLALMVPVVVFLSYFLAISVSVVKDNGAKAQSSLGVQK